LAPLRRLVDLQQSGVQELTANFARSLTLLAMTVLAGGGTNLKLFELVGADDIVFGGFRWARAVSPL
jgi:hypothetical protein